MKMNGELVRKMREARSWSQEELGLAAGLNLRTVQRIENESSASLQSRKALASALEASVRDLDYEEVRAIRRYEYKTLEINSKEGFLTGIRRGKLPDFTGLLNTEGKAGWKLVQILTPDLAQAVWSAKTGRLVALFQREYVE